MEFTKMHGAGNDFIIINNLDMAIPLEELPKLAKNLCRRRLSVGADGLMAVLPALGEADARMLFYNCDGTLGEMCGNGARCVCRYAYELGISDETQRIETTAGIITGQRINEQYYRIALNLPSVVKPGLRAELDGMIYSVTYVELGDPGIPHCVVQMADFDKCPEDSLRVIGRQLRYSHLFPRGANVNFVKPLAPGRVKAVTYERGVEDFTLACGTGCGSIATALLYAGELPKGEVEISMPGGDLTVEIEGTAGDMRALYLTGPTKTVCRGEIPSENF